MSGNLNNQSQLTELLMDQAYTGTLLTKRMDAYLSIHGLSFNEFIIMQKISQTAGGAISRVNLADSMGLTASGVTRLLAPMIKNNIIDKAANPRDARQSMVTLTKTGKELVVNARVTVEEGCESFYTLLNKKEVQQLIGLLKKIKC